MNIHFRQQKLKLSHFLAVTSLALVALFSYAAIVPMPSNTNAAKPLHVGIGNQTVQSPLSINSENSPTNTSLFVNGIFQANNNVTVQDQAFFTKQLRVGPVLGTNQTGKLSFAGNAVVTKDISNISFADATAAPLRNVCAQQNGMLVLCSPTVPTPAGAATISLVIDSGVKTLSALKSSQHRLSWTGTGIVSCSSVTPTSTNSNWTTKTTITDFQDITVSSTPSSVTSYGIKCLKTGTTNDFVTDSVTISILPDVTASLDIVSTSIAQDKGIFPYTGDNKKALLFIENSGAKLRINAAGTSSCVINTSPATVPGPAPSDFPYTTNGTVNNLEKFILPTVTTTYTMNCTSTIGTALPADNVTIVVNKINPGTQLSVSNASFSDIGFYTRNYNYQVTSAFQGASFSGQSQHSSSQSNQNNNIDAMGIGTICTPTSGYAYSSYVNNIPTYKALSFEIGTITGSPYTNDPSIASFRKKIEFVEDARNQGYKPFYGVESANARKGLLLNNGVPPSGGDTFPGQAFNDTVNIIGPFTVANSNVTYGEVGSSAVALYAPKIEYPGNSYRTNTYVLKFSLTNQAGYKTYFQDIRPYSVTSCGGEGN
jgi:hypothetical protein